MEGDRGIKFNFTEIKNMIIIEEGYSFYSMYNLDF